MDRFVGKRLDGRYEIREVIGVGGMAVVYKAYDSIEDRIVAVKILKEEFASNDEFLRRFKNESKAIAVLSHPNIVKVFDVSFGDLIQYIVMEYIDGITLKQYIDQQGSLVWKDVVHFTVQILRGLQHAHDKGIVHRDVKPQNIMLLPDGTIKVTDFGIARFARSEQQTITDKAIGSVHYISPEQARGETTDEKADIYSVGVMLFEMLTGQLPFQAESAVSVAIMQLQSEPKLPRSINQSIPLGLEQITMHAMQKDSGRRYQSAAEMLRDLEEFRRDPQMEFDYSYFIDDSPTKFVDTKESNELEATEAGQKSPIIPILAGIAGAFVVAIIFLVVIFLPKLFGSSGTTINCPDLIGKTYTELTENAEYKDLVYDVTYDHTSDYETGVIYAQSPEAGRSIKKTQTISITVSMGASIVTVPDVSNLDYAAASMNLKSKGFTVKITYKQHDSIANDRVISTSPAANSNVDEGSEIEVYVSMGPEISYVDVPNVVKYSNADDAKSEIESSGLTFGGTTKVDSELPEGTVVSQSLKAGTQVVKGSALSLEISTGVPPVVEYVYPFKLVIPNDLEDEKIKVIAYLDGTEYSTSGMLLVDTLPNRTYSFNITTTKTSGTVTIMFQDSDGVSYRFRDYFVDFTDVNSMPKYISTKHDDNYNRTSSTTSPSGSSSNSSTGNTTTSTNTTSN